MKQSQKADLAILGLSFIWGATFSIVKNALTDVSPFVFNAIRFIIASILFWILFRRNFGKFENQVVKAGLITGFFMAIGFSFQTAGLYYTTASKSAFITGFCVILVPLFTVILEKVIPKINVISGALVALCGLWLLTVPEGWDKLNFGDILTSFCAVFFAIHLICIEIFTKKYNYIILAFFQLITTALINFISIPIFETPRLVLTMNAFWSIIITSVICSTLAIYILNRYQRYTTAVHASIIFTMEPVFAYIIAYLFYGEKLGATGTIGAGLILFGMILSEIKRK